MYAKKNIEDYLKELASKSPVPGGGSAAALIAATAASLLGKVANFTLGKEKFKVVESQMQDVLKRCSALTNECMRLCSLDAEVYEKFGSVYKLPKGEKRQSQMQKVLKEAASVPLVVCKKSYEGIKLCLPVAEKGNSNLMTDTGIASGMFLCAFRSALLNVDVNLKYIKDEKFIKDAKDLTGPMCKDAERIDETVKKKVESYLRK